MADFYPALLAELQTVMHAVWNEITLPNGSANSNFFTSLQLMKRNIVSIINAGTPALPYGCVGIGAFPAGSVTMDKSDRQAQLVFFYMDSENNGATQTTVNAKLQAMEAYLRSYDSSSFRIMEDGSINSSDLSMINSALTTESFLSVLGGDLTYLNVYTVSV